MMRSLIALAVIFAALFALENARSGVMMTRFSIGDTPVTAYEHPGADGPIVVMAHGFAGSSQMMQGYALPLARAGYRVFAFDFLGHGRHPVPMSGDVTSVDGTTRLLVEQVSEVVDAVSNGETIALLGHSMATDVLVRVDQARDDIGPVVLLSAFSREIDAMAPDDLLLVVGAWEPGLRAFALDAARMVDPTAEPGETVTNGTAIRRASVAPHTEHVSILHSQTGRQEAVAWMDRAFGRSSAVGTWPTGPAIAGLVGGLVVLLAGLARRLPLRETPALPLTRRQMLAVTLAPALVTPPVALALDPGFMPVLVADYLALHLAIYGGLQLALLVYWRMPLGSFAPAAFTLLLAGAGLIGIALDRYAANFWPTEGRVSIIAITGVGAVVFFVADACLAHRATIVRRLAVHGAFLGSLVLAVALDFEELFFLLMIAPIIVLFYLVFGTMGHAASSRMGPLAAGIALGLVLAWALGVSFPLFEA